MAVSDSDRSESMMIVAGEVSGDLHGSFLVREIKAMAPDVSLWGMGGGYLRDAGVRLLYDARKLAVVGISEVLYHLVDIRRARRALIEEMERLSPSLVILIDFPDFNLSLAKHAVRLGIPVFYYISPQVWAWRSGRVRTIKRLVRQMAVILPFEKDFYASKGMEVAFVGHPLLDEIEVRQSRGEFCKKYHVNPQSEIVAILPGSRKKEILSVLPTFIEAARSIAAQKPHTVFFLALAPSLTLDDIEECGVDLSDLPMQVIFTDRYDLMAHSSLAMAASGTVTLELALLDTPMVVAYRVSAMTYFLGRRLIKVQYASLVNLIADEEVVPELSKRILPRLP